MDLNQQKLTKTEWDTTEIPISQEEREILKLIITGYSDVNYIYNKNMSISNYLKLEPNDGVNHYLYNEHFLPMIRELITTYDFEFQSNIQLKLQRLVSIEKMKLEHLSKTLQDCGDKIFEFYLLHIAKQTNEILLQRQYEKNSIKITIRSFI